jgi:hypothetical protein
MSGTCTFKRRMLERARPGIKKNGTEKEQLTRKQGGLDIQAAFLLWLPRIIWPIARRCKDAA